MSDDADEDYMDLLRRYNAQTQKLAGAKTALFAVWNNRDYWERRALISEFSLVEKAAVFRLAAESCSQAQIVAEIVGIIAKGRRA